MNKNIFFIKNKIVLIFSLMVVFIFLSCTEDNSTSPDDEQFNDLDENTAPAAKPVLNSINTSSWTLMFEDNLLLVP